MTRAGQVPNAQELIERAPERAAVKFALSDFCKPCRGSKTGVNREVNMRNLFLAIGVLAASPLLAEPASIRLVCTVYDSSDGAAKLSSPRPKDVITVRYSANGDATITSKLHQKELIGTVTEHEIAGRWRGASVSAEIYINRYTSEYRFRTILDDSTQEPTAVFGSCQMSGKPTS